MTRFLARYGIFILFPILIAAIIFLAAINFKASQNFGRWGEKSIVESTYQLAEEKVDRVESEIISTDNSFFQIVDPAHLDLSCIRWKTGIKSNLVEAAAIVDEDAQVVQFYHRTETNKEATPIYQLLQTQIVPKINYYDSMFQSKHYHWPIDDQTKLVSTYSTIYEGQLYTAVLLYNMEEIAGHFFESLIEDVGKNRVINVVDSQGNIIFGNDMSNAGDFSVAKRFPTTLYQWKIQLAPISAAYYVKKQERAEISWWFLIPASFGVIVFGLIVLAMVWVRERRLNALKSEFISNTSHELKTPLALIRMFAELLAMGQVTSLDKAASYHQIILRETERLTTLIDNVLDFSRIERGKNVYRFERFNPRSVTESALDIYRHRVESIGAKLIFDAPEQMPEIMADKDAYTLVLLNLIDNAVKYATGTDIVGVELYCRGKYMFLDVFDRGKGIPTGHLKRIFERFYRYQPQNETHRQRGSGIGLSLVKHIARGHGGTVTVSSTPGVETRFSIRFSLAGPERTT